MTEMQAADRSAADAQAQHAPAVLAGRLRLADTWGQPCLGYLLMIRPGRAASAAFAALQDSVLRLEPGLLRQPERALHCTAGFLVPVYREADQPKDEIWQQHGARWLELIAACAAACTAPLRLRFRRLVATDAAIIAVADLPNPVTELRHALSAELNLPWPLAKGPLVHVSLFRYRQPLHDPAALLDRLRAIDVAIETAASELLAVRETTFPALAYEVLHRLPIGGPAQ